MVLLCQIATSPGAGQTRGDPAAQAAETLTPVFKSNQLESVLGRDVRTRVEEDGGRIIDLLADRSGRVHAAVIEFGGFLGIGTRKIAVEWSALRFESDGKQTVVIVDLTRDQLRVAPEYKPNEPAVVRRVAD
jgi:predicted O-methyltransferase YrrM